MVREYQIFAIDALTGKIFHPEIEFSMYGRVLKDKDKAELTYHYTSPVPGIIELPPGYEVLPVQILIGNRQNLSAEANGVMEKTKQVLFNPVMPKIQQALRKNTDPRILRELAAIMRMIEAA